MKFEIVELEGFSGNSAKIYSVIIDGEEDTLFEDFISSHEGNYEKEVDDIVNRVMLIGNKHGARAQYFKEYEGIPGDGMCALYDMDESNLRLYCLRYGTLTVVLGGGGPKGKDIRAWQEDGDLNYFANMLIEISCRITKRIKDKEIKLSNNGELDGNLIFNDDEEEE